MQSTAEKQSEKEPTTRNATQRESNNSEPRHVRGRVKTEYRPKTEGEGQRGRGDNRGDKEYAPRTPRGRGENRGGRGRAENRRSLDAAEGSESLYKKPSERFDGAEKGNYKGNNFRADFKERRGGERGGRGGDRGGDRGGRGGRGRGGYHKWESARDGNADEEVVELDEEQMKLVNEKKVFARQTIKIVDDDQVIRICVDNDFNSEKIDKALNKFKTSDKYAGLQDFEWNDVTSKGMQRDEKKRQALADERKRIALEKKRQQDEFRKAKTAEMQQKRLEREKAAEERRKAKEEEDARIEEEEAQDAKNNASVEDEAAVAQEESKQEAPAKKKRERREKKRGADEDGQEGEEAARGRGRERRGRGRGGRHDEAGTKQVWKAKSNQDDKKEDPKVNEDQEDAPGDDKQAQAQVKAIAEQVLDTKESHESGGRSNKKEAPKASQLTPPPQMFGNQDFQPVGMNPMMMQGASPTPQGNMTPEAQQLYQQQIIYMQQQAIQQYQQLLQYQAMMQSQTGNGTPGQMPQAMPGIPGMPQMQPGMQPGMQMMMPQTWQQTNNTAQSAPHGKSTPKKR